MPNHGGNLQRNHNEKSMKHFSYKKDKEKKRKKEMRKEEREKQAPFSHGK